MGIPAICPICKLDIPMEARVACLCMGGDGAPIKWVTREELQKMYDKTETKK